MWLVLWMFLMVTWYSTQNPRYHPCYDRSADSEFSSSSVWKPAIEHGTHQSVRRPRFGIDVLRWWASSVDFTKDVSITFDQLGYISETCRKLRSTARFLLGNAFPDGSPASSDEISIKQLGLVRICPCMLMRSIKFSLRIVKTIYFAAHIQIERYTLHTVYEFYRAIISAYNAMAFNQG